MDNWNFYRQAWLELIITHVMVMIRSHKQQVTQSIFHTKLKMLIIFIFDHVPWSHTAVTKYENLKFLLQTNGTQPYFIVLKKGDIAFKKKGLIRYHFRYHNTLKAVYEIGIKTVALTLLFHMLYCTCFLPSHSLREECALVKGEVSQ